MKYKSSTDQSDINLFAINEESSKRRKNEIDYANWGNPNQLVDRLRLLIAEPVVGDDSHTNEICMIIREQREQSEYIRLKI